MDAEALQAFLAKPHDAIISTNRVEKGSQLNPVWFVWDGESFLFSTQKASVKYANIARDPNISVMVNDPVTHTYVVAYGRAEIVGLERYPELGNAIVEKYIPADQRQQFGFPRCHCAQAGKGGWSGLDSSLAPRKRTAGNG